MRRGRRERLDRQRGRGARGLRRRLADAGHHSGTIVDLGCGGGTLAAVLVDAGYEEERLETMVLDDDAYHEATGGRTSVRDAHVVAIADQLDAQAAVHNDALDRLRNALF